MSKGEERSGVAETNMSESTEVQKCLLYSRGSVELNSVVGDGRKGENWGHFKSFCFFQAYRGMIFQSLWILSSLMH